MTEIQVVGRLDLPGWHDLLRRVYSTEGLCPTIPTASGGGHIPKIILEDSD